MAKKILLASDGSDNAIRATKETVKLAGITQAAVVIAYVESSADTKERDEVLQAAPAELNETLELLTQSSISHEVVILHGEPAEAIAEYANQNDFNHLVIGSRGLNALQEMVLGSVSYEVMKLAKCPVLIVK